MIRPLTLLTLVAAAGAGLYLYQVKHSVSQLDRELRGINRQTEQARERTQVLRAEWALLNEPDRLRQVAQRHLPLEAMTPGQFVRMAEMERRLPSARAFAGQPSLFAPVEPAGDGSATAIAFAAATPRARAAAEAAPAAPAVVAAPAPAATPAPAAPVATAAATPAPEPARAEPPARPAPPARLAAAAPRPALAPHVRQAVLVERPAAPALPQRVAAPMAAPAVVSALGRVGPALAPPVPIARAAAATLSAPGAR
jgi:hypothetical protein